MLTMLTTCSMFFCLTFVISTLLSRDQPVRAMNHGKV